MKDKMIQLYHWSDPEEMIYSQYGHVTIKEWLIREGHRILNDHSRCVEIKTNALDQISLFVNDVTKNVIKNQIM